MKKARAFTSFFIICLSFCTVSNATMCSIGKRDGNVRAGPGTEYKVIGEIKRWDMFPIPTNWTKFEANWIPIESRTKSKEAELVGWYQKALAPKPDDKVRFYRDIDKSLLDYEEGWLMKSFPMKKLAMIHIKKSNIGLSGESPFIRNGFIGA